MKRLGRWLFNLAAVVSLLTCVASIIFWERSRRGGDRLKHFDPELYWVFESWEGQLSFSYRSGAAITRTVSITLPNGSVDVHPANDPGALVAGAGVSAQRPKHAQRIHLPPR